MKGVALSEQGTSNGWVTTPLDYRAAREKPYKGERLFSRYVEVRDGTRLAVDVRLPGTAPEKKAYPVVASFTPYYRRFKLRQGHRSGVEASPNQALYRDGLVPHGYALVSIDVRGTGASFGSRDGFRSPRERLDHFDICDWIARQPWCDGNIGATGISYLGAASDFLATTNHPAVKAIVPLFSVWDTWSNHLYPGGVLCTAITRNYGDLSETLDRDLRDRIPNYAYFADPDLAGPAPVDDDPAGEFLEQALYEHIANFDMQDFAQQFRHRDDGLSDNPDYTSACISPYHYWTPEADAGTAVHSITGWMDGGGFSMGAIQRHTHLTNPANRLTIGPWDHGARAQASPWRDHPGEPQQPIVIAEVLRFFDAHLRADAAAVASEKPVHYYTMGEERWKGADSWPPAATMTDFYFAPDQGLGDEPPAAGGPGHNAGDDYQADYDCRTGFSTRYDRLYVNEVATYYVDWDGRDAKMLTYTSDPFAADSEVTGHPEIDLHFTCSEKDCALFVYVADVTPDGRCVYVTEGVFRALHRKPGTGPANIPAIGPQHSFNRADAATLVPGEPAAVSFGLLPVSYLFRAGHRVRLAIAAADSDHFTRIPDGRPPILTLLRQPGRASCLRLPIVGTEG